MLRRVSGALVPEGWSTGRTAEAQLVRIGRFDMMRLMDRLGYGVLALLCGVGLSACARAAAQATPLAGSSRTVTVQGQLSPLRLDQVSAVSLKDGRLVARGSFESVTIDLPPFVDTTQVIRHWALVTESSLDDKKVLSFTHDESLDDFTIEVPATDAEIRYGVFAHRQGGEVMVLAWGTDATCYWAFLVIGPRTGASGR